MSNSIISSLQQELKRDSLASSLLRVVCLPTGISSSGYPFLEQAAWELFRDHIPHILGMGGKVLDACTAIRDTLPEGEQGESIRRACKVVEQVVLTSAITAPPSLWLSRYLLGCYKYLGLLDRLLAGEAITPALCSVSVNGEEQVLSAEELNTDFLFFLSMGYVEQYDDSYRIAGHPRVRQLFSSVDSTPITIDSAGVWTRLFKGEVLNEEEKEMILGLGFGAVARKSVVQTHWLPTLEEIELGYRLVPVVVALRAAGVSDSLKEGETLNGKELSAASIVCGTGALEILTAAGYCERKGENYRITRIGERGLSRGPGPFGIIHTYHPYMTQAQEIVLANSGKVWVERGENVAASQDANRGTFLHANKALDAFVKKTGFDLKVFIEHAIGRGEATRQRYERAVDKDISYVGADLEDAAIDAAIIEQSAGHLPKNMIFVRQADIGKPEVLLLAMKNAGIEPRGAVMMVGNGFHEVRNQTDESMTEVFRGYCDAGILLLFTEENALAIDDIRQTAWNTYHAGFKYVHEKSGQGLRPAYPRAGVRLGRGLRAAWSECAQAGGYYQATEYCVKTRTIYPYPPRSGTNPSISVNHFFVPMALAKELGL